VTFSVGHGHRFSALRADHASTFVDRTDSKTFTANTNESNAIRFLFVFLPRFCPDSFRDSPDRLYQFTGINRLRQVLIRSNTAGQSTGFVAIDGGKDQDRNRFIRMLQTIANFETGFSGQDQIKQNEVGLLHHKRRLCLSTVLRDDHGHSVSLKNQFCGVGAIDIVLDNQNQVDCDIDIRQLRPAITTHGFTRQSLWTRIVDEGFG